MNIFLSTFIGYHHKKIKDAKKLMTFLQENFADISQEISGIIDKNISELEKIKLDLEQKIKVQTEREQQYNDWKKKISYETKIGLIFKDTFKISVDGITWKGKFTPLENITGISYGGINQYLNHIYIGTDYEIAFETSQYIEKITPNEKKFYEISEHLWLALAAPISTLMLKHVRRGGVLYIGRIVLDDNGVYQMINGSHSVHRLWSQNYFMLNSCNGEFIITTAGKNGYSASASYIRDMNTHILEAILREFFKTGGKKLSDLL